MLTGVHPVPTYERALASLGEVGGCLSFLVVGVICLAIYLFLLLLIWTGLTALVGGDLWFQGSGGMPGTGEPTPVLGLVASAAAVFVMGWSWTWLKRARSRVGLSRPEREPDDRKIPQEVLIAVLKQANADGTEMRSEKTDNSGDRLEASRRQIGTLVEGRRTWLVQARRAVALPTSTHGYNYPNARNHLDRVLEATDPGEGHLRSRR